MPENFAPGVEIVELKRNLAMVKSAVGVATSHGYEFYHLQQSTRFD